MAYTKPQQWKEEESEGLRGEGNQIKFIALRFEKLFVAGMGFKLRWLAVRKRHS